MAYPSQQKNFDSRLPRGGGQHRRPQDKWNEEKAERAVTSAFGKDYCTGILTVSTTGYNDHIDRIKRYMELNAGDIST